jgi:hypothetical protein
MRDDARGAGTAGRSAVFASSRWSRPGEEHGEPRPAAALAVGPDVAAALRHDAVHRRQTESGSLPHLLGGKERLEDVGQVFRGNARAGIGHDQADELAPGAAAPGGLFRT